MNPDDEGDFAAQFRNYRIDVEDGVTKVRVLNAPRNEETLKMIRFLCDNDLCQRRLVDLRRALPFTASDLIEFAAQGRALMRERNRFALLIDDATERDPLDVLTVYREQKGLSEVAVYDNEQAAISWLCELPD
ncbi:MAG: hypothetical protein AAF660_02750 [Pseudomonadota bacterium]